MKKKTVGARKHEGINHAERIGAHAYAHTHANKHSARAVLTQAQCARCDNPQQNYSARTGKSRNKK